MNKEMFQIFFRIAISQNSPGYLAKGPFICLVNLIIIVLIGLRMGNSRWIIRKNFLTAVRELIRSHKGLKETEPLVDSCSKKKLF